MEVTCAAQDVCGDAGQLLSETGHVGLGDVHPLKHADRGLSLDTKNGPLNKATTTTSTTVQARLCVIAVLSENIQSQVVHSSSNETTNQ